MAAVAFRRMFGGAVRSTGKRYMSATTQLGTVSMAGTSSFSSPAPEVETRKHICLIASYIIYFLLSRIVPFGSN